jgi:hypothetical protein
MARSSYIYIFQTIDNKPLAAFTVKHEAITFWENHLDSDPTYVLLRIYDGGPRLDYVTKTWDAGLTVIPLEK